MELVPVTTANDVGLATIITLVAGVGGYDPYPTPSVTPIRIMVDPADLDRARDVLAQYDTMPDEEDEDL